MEFKRFELDYIKSNMYVCVENDNALIIDPNISEKGLQYLNGQNITSGVIILTHEHFDHTTGVNPIREMFPFILICQKECAKSIENSRKNRPLSLLLISSEDDKKTIRNFFDSFELYECKSDIVFDDRYEMKWNNHTIIIQSTPGHSKGSVCIEIDNRYIFTGDSLIPNTPVITRYPGGSLEEYESITLPYLKRKKSDFWVLPGHGECFKLGEKTFGE